MLPSPRHAFIVWNGVCLLLSFVFARRTFYKWGSQTFRHDQDWELLIKVNGLDIVFQQRNKWKTISRSLFPLFTSWLVQAREKGFSKTNLWPASDCAWGKRLWRWPPFSNLEIKKLVLIIPYSCSYYFANNNTDLSLTPLSTSHFNAISSYHWICLLYLLTDQRNRKSIAWQQNATTVMEINMVDSFSWIKSTRYTYSEPLLWSPPGLGQTFPAGALVAFEPRKWPRCHFLQNIFSCLLSSSPIAAD